eukprot:gb/GECH01010540.1/.p1 GENE.gb/GECH01010540.1/~~gb/GECH01010540.1/.p1  ORF type:complete len:284 (+),score=64.82 gb/GECH01010540.1/:1-852(+)
MGQEEIDDEVLVLASMYDDELQEREHGQRYEMHIPADDAPTDTPAMTLSWTYPEGYPEQTFPSYVLRAPWLSGDALGPIHKTLVQIWEEGGRAVVLFAWIEWLRNNAYTFSGAKQRAAERQQQQRASPSNSRNHESQQQQEDSGILEDHGIQLLSSEPFTEKKSKFIAHAARIQSAEQADAAVSLIKKDRRLSTATHNISAYRVRRTDASGEERMVEVRDDDGETGAGDKLLFLLQRAHADGVLVVVTRWYGGVLLGPRRFRIITHIAKELLQHHNMISSSHK